MHALSRSNLTNYDSSGGGHETIKKKIGTQHGQSTDSLIHTQNMHLIACSRTHICMLRLALLFLCSSNGNEDIWAIASLTCIGAEKQPRC